MCTELYALLMSWAKSQISLFCVCVSWSIFVRICMGCVVEEYGRATKLYGSRIGYLDIIWVSLLVMILVKIFRVCSRRVIGLMWLSWPVKIGFLEIGYILLCFQAVGISVVFKHLVNRIVRSFIIWGWICLSISLEISVGPVAFLLGDILIVLIMSCWVIGSISVLYHVESILVLRLYSFFYCSQRAGLCGLCFVQFAKWFFIC